MPDFARMIDELQYSIIVLIAGIHWSLQEALLMAGFTIKLVNQWLIENAFMPIIAQTNNSLSIAVSYVFIVALLVLGITYLLAAFVRLDVVSPRSAFEYKPSDVPECPQWFKFKCGGLLFAGTGQFQRLGSERPMRPIRRVLTGCDKCRGD